MIDLCLRSSSSTLYRYIFLFYVIYVKKPFAYQGKLIYQIQHSAVVLISYTLKTFNGHFDFLYVILVDECVYMCNVS